MVSVANAVQIGIGQPTISNGVITGISITSGGSGFTTAPTVSITDDGGGSGAAATATISGGIVTSVSVTSGGSGYSANTDVYFLPSAGDLGTTPDDPDETVPDSEPDTSTQPDTTPDDPTTGTIKFGNLSSRGFADTLASGGALITGFIIEGNEPKSVLVRGLGPTLELLNVPGFMTDPWFYVINLDTLETVGQNDNWADAPGISGHSLQPLRDNDAALILENLDPGPYAVVLSGINDETGVGLIEVYEEGTSSSSTLGNASSRGFADTLASGGARIVGFIVEGDEGATVDVAVRALGPSLQNLGVTTGFLSNPSVYLFNLDTQETIGVNDDFETVTDGRVETLDGHPTLEPPNSLDSGFIIRGLTPGNYAAVAYGVNDVTGIVLVDVTKVE